MRDAKHDKQFLSCVKNYSKAKAEFILDPHPHGKQKCIMLSLIDDPHPHPQGIPRYYI